MPTHVAQNQTLSPAANNTTPASDALETAKNVDREHHPDPMLAGWSPGRVADDSDEDMT